MKRTTCPGCGQATPHLVVPYCSPCMDDMVKSMKGEK